MRKKIIKHSVCILLAWFLGPVLAAFLTELLVWMGARMDFTWLDWFFRILLFPCLELGYTLASYHITQFTAED